MHFDMKKINSMHFEIISNNIRSTLFFVWCEPEGLTNCPNWTRLVGSLDRTRSSPLFLCEHWSTNVFCSMTFEQGGNKIMWVSIGYLIMPTCMVGAFILMWKHKNGNDWLLMRNLSRFNCTAKSSDDGKISMCARARLLEENSDDIKKITQHFTVSPYCASFGKRDWTESTIAYLLVTGVGFKFREQPTW